MKTVPAWMKEQTSSTNIDRLSSIKYAKKSVYADEQGLTQGTSTIAQESSAKKKTWKNLTHSQSQPKLALAPPL